MTISIGMISIVSQPSSYVVVEPTTASVATVVGSLSDAPATIPAPNSALRLFRCLGIADYIPGSGSAAPAENRPCMERRTRSLVGWMVLLAVLAVTAYVGLSRHRDEPSAAAAPIAMFDANPGTPLERA